MCNLTYLQKLARSHVESVPIALIFCFQVMWTCRQRIYRITHFQQNIPEGRFCQISGYIMSAFVAISMLQHSHFPMSKDYGGIDHVNRRRRRENGRALLSTQKFIGGKSTKIHRRLHKPSACRLLSSIVELGLVMS